MDSLTDGVQALRVNNYSIYLDLAILMSSLLLKETQ